MDENIHISERKTIFLGVMCVCAGYCWKGVNFSALGKKLLLDHKHIQELGFQEPSNPETRRQSQRLQIALFCLTNGPKTQRYSIYYNFQQIITFFFFYKN